MCCFCVFVLDCFSVIKVLILVCFVFVWGLLSLVSFCRWFDSGFNFLGVEGGCSWIMLLVCFFFDFRICLGGNR